MVDTTFTTDCDQSEFSHKYGFNYESLHFINSLIPERSTTCFQDEDNQLWTNVVPPPAPLEGWTGEAKDIPIAPDTELSISEAESFAFRKHGDPIEENRKTSSACSTGTGNPLLNQNQSNDTPPTIFGAIESNMSELQVEEPKASVVPPTASYQFLRTNEDEDTNVISCIHNV